MAARKKNRSQKELEKYWEECVNKARSFSYVNINESAQEKKDRIEALEADPEKWFQYYFPKSAYARPAAFHIEATKRVLNNPEWYEVRMWSRELAKSTRTMMETLYLGLTGKKHYILLISSSEDNAVRLLMPYKANLEFNPAIIRDYGEQVKYGSWKSNEFTTKKGLAFRAVGMDQPPRGAKTKDGVRPDVLLFDDVDTDIDCRNPEMVSKNWDWIDQAAMGTQSMSVDTLTIFCGNRIAIDCCVVRACAFANYVDEINIKDENGNITWPEKNTEERIAAKLAKRSYAAIQKEYYNNPIVEGSVFKQMSYKPALPLNQYSLLVCYTDPSFKDTKKNDYKATVLVGKWKDEFHVIECYLEQTTTAKMIEWFYSIMEIVGDRSCYYAMEQGFLQDIILKEVYEAGKTRGKTIPISGDTRVKDNKFVRIETLLEPLNRNGKLFLNEDKRKNAHMKRLDEQFMALSATSRAHDDGPDAVEGAVWIINNKEAVRAVGGINIIKRKPNSKRF